MIKLNKKSKKLILLQRNELLSEKQKILRKRFGRFLFTNFFVHFFQNQKLDESVQNLFEKEYEIIKKFLPSNASNILDIGCGLAILDIFLAQNYEKPIFFLIDKNKVDLKIKYGFSKNYESYNNLNETKKVLLANNILDEQIFIKNASLENNITVSKELLNDLQKTFSEKIDLMFLIRNYLESIGQIHEEIRKVLKPNLEKWEKIMMETIDNDYIKYKQFTVNAD